MIKSRRFAVTEQFINRVINNQFMKKSFYL